jgi:hypothetical protein
MTTSTKKIKRPAPKPTLRQLQWRISEASASIAMATTQPFDRYETFQHLDEAVRTLQGDRYEQFVKEWTAPQEDQPKGFLWRKGDPGEEERWYGSD